MADRVSSQRKKKTAQFRGKFTVWIIVFYIILKHLSNHIDFYNKRLQMLFIDQLVRSKATCSFNVKHAQFLSTEFESAKRSCQVVCSNYGLFFQRGHNGSGFSAISQKIYPVNCIYIYTVPKNQRYTFALKTCRHFGVFFFYQQFRRKSEDSFVRRGGER